MNDSLCELTLIYPAWLAWAIMGLGVFSFWYGSRQFANGQITIEWPKILIEPAFLLLVIGLVCFAGGMVLVGALNYPPLARFVLDKAPILVDKANNPVSVEAHDRPLADVVPLGDTGAYTVRMSAGARQVRITREIRAAACKAELFRQICRDEPDRLTCSTDADAKILRICAKTDEKSCIDRSL